ncbi:MAG: hypothetical protein DSY80_08265 [Desulfocapsa sp.]|nr:MAG: hypothetical protein DSY80_08265 [Desulfocapsa sp.]
MTVSDPCKLSELQNISPEPGRPVLLFQQDDHAVYWLGSAEHSVFRCNSYLIRDGDQGVLIDPGGKNIFREIKKNLTGLMPLQQLTGMVLSHQDPDVAASMPDWLQLQPGLRVFATPRTHVLLPYYGSGEYRAVDVEQHERFQFNSNNELLFIPSPFLHFPGAVTTIDFTSGYLFSGDVWAALDTEWRLVVDDFAGHTAKMDLFHKDYMAGNAASRGYAESLSGQVIRALLPQHGSIIPEEFMGAALDYLKNLQCGLDLIYPCLEFCPLSDYESCEKSLVNNRDVFPDEDVSENGFIPETEMYAPHLQQALEQAARQAHLKDLAVHRLKISDLCLKQKEARLKEAQALGHIGHWEWDIQTGQVRWSDEVYRIGGHEVNEFKPSYETFLKYVHPDDRQMVEDAVAEAIEKDAPCQVTHRIIRPDGTVRIVRERSAQVQRDRNGAPVFLMGTVQDITESATITKNLAETNRLLGMVQRVQEGFIRNRDVAEIYNSLLADLLQFSESSDGFIGDVFVTPEKKPYLRAYIFTDLSCNQENTELYEQVEGRGFEFHDLDNLLGAPVTSGKAVISNDPATDPRSKKDRVPPGHLKLHSFLGIPIIFGDQVVGEIGLANRQGGYDEKILEDLAPLVTALAQVMMAQRNLTALKATEKILEQKAKLDGLLEIPNRRYFDEYLELQIKNALREHTPFSVIMIDVDFFKLYNDFYGHQKGDQCLVELAAIMKENLCRPLDIVARYGGEEFCCILPGTVESGAADVAQRLQERIAEHAIPHAATSRMSDSDVVTVSMGIAAWKPGTETSPHAVVGRADAALYEAKHAGRNRIVVHRD